MLNLLRCEPMLTGGFVQALVLALSVFLFHWEAAEVAAAQGLALAAVALFVRQTVTPTVKVAEKLTEAATKTVEKLDETVIGVVGTVTGTAREAISSSVDEVLRGD